MDLAQLLREVLAGAKRRGATNVASATNVDSSGRVTSVYSDDDVTIVQRDGETTVVRKTNESKEEPE